MARGIKTGSRDWKSGENGNPKGRPKGEKAMTDLAREYLNGSQEIVVGKGKQKHTVLLKRKEMFVRAVFQAAIKGTPTNCTTLLMLGFSLAHSVASGGRQSTLLCSVGQI